MTDTAMKILRESGAVLTNDHFVLSSRRHSPAYVAKQKALIEPEHGWKLAELMSVQGELLSRRVDTVIGPVAGAVSLAYLVALYIGRRQGTPIRAIYAEKGPNDTYEVKEEFRSLIERRRVLVVDDILTTGGSALKVIEAVRQMGGEVVGLSVICNRGGVETHQVGHVPFINSLIELDLESWDEAECELCKAGVPVNPDYGRGKEFLAARTVN